MTPSPASPPPLEVYLLGLVDFEDVQQLQRRLVYDLGERGGAALVLCEHPPTISVGRSGSRVHIAADDDELRAMGIKVHWVNRGGGCVLHLPGQLAAYLALPLDRLGPRRPGATSTASTTRSSASSTSSTCRGRPGPTLPGRLPGPRPGRVGRRGGQPLDRLPRADPERRAVPGAVRADSTSRGSARTRSGRRRWSRAGSGPTPMPKVREALIRQLEAAFGLERHHVYTHHPLIRRKVLAHVYAPSPG